MKTEEEHNFKFRPDFEELGDTFIQANIAKSDDEPVYIHLENGGYSVYHTKQIIQCMQSAIQKIEKG